MKNDNLNKLYDLLSKLLEIDIKTITDETSPENTVTWDSFNGLLMVSELEELFSINFSIEEVYAVTCVKDIRDVLIRHKVSFE